MPGSGGHGGGGGHSGGFGGGGHLGGFGGGGFNGFRGGMGPRPGGFGWFGWGPRRYGYGCGPGCGGCLLPFIFIAFAAVLIFLLASRTNLRSNNEYHYNDNDNNYDESQKPDPDTEHGNNGNDITDIDDITPSTKQRTPMDPQYITVTNEWFTDKIGAIENRELFLAGLKEFYSKTGIQPYVYFTDSIGSYNDIEKYAYDLYLDLFKDEGHLLMVFVRGDNDEWQLMIGDNASSVMDDEACKILLDYTNYYYHSSGSFSQGFSDIFSSAADRIMGGVTHKNSDSGNPEPKQG